MVADSPVVAFCDGNTYSTRESARGALTAERRLSTAFDSGSRVLRSWVADRYGTSGSVTYCRPSNSARLWSDSADDHGAREAAPGRFHPTGRRSVSLMGAVMLSRQ
jgi:hypothetical protein